MTNSPSRAEINGWKRVFVILPVNLLEGGTTYLSHTYKRQVDLSAPYTPIFETQYTNRPDKIWGNFGDLYD